MESDNQKNEPLSRRQALKRVGGGAAGLALAGVLTPLLRFFAFPIEKDPTPSSDTLLSAGPVARFPEGKPVKVVLKGQRIDGWTRESDVKVGSVWVTRRGNSFDVFSSICPHLGCAVNAEKDGFHCPCHGSFFKENGERLLSQNGSNPSPRDLDSLEWKEEQSTLFIAYKRYKLGRDSKEEI